MWAFDGRAKHDNGFSFIGIFDIDENKNSSTSLSKKSHRHEQRIWNDSYIFTSLWDCYGSLYVWSTEPSSHKTKKSVKVVV